MADWFAVNAPGQATTPGPAKQQQAAGPVATGGDWFAANAPKPGDSLPVAETPATAPSNDMGALSATAAAGAAAIPAAKWLAEHIATSPTINGLVSKVGGRAAGAVNPAIQAYEVVSGRKGPLAAMKDAALGEAGRRGIAAIPRVAAGVAEGLAAPAAVPIAGGLAGLAGTTGFLAALQHDANRHVDIDYTKDTPDTAVARVFSNMRDSEANRGKTLDQRQDDPNDVMFQPDDSVTVRGGAAPESPGMLQRLAILAGLR